MVLPESIVLADRTSHSILWSMYPDTLPVRIVRFFTTILDDIILADTSITIQQYRFTIGDHDIGLTWDVEQSGRIGLVQNPDNKRAVWATITNQGEGRCLPMASIVKIEWLVKKAPSVIVYRHPKYHENPEDIPTKALPQSRIVKKVSARNLQVILPREAVDGDSY